MGAWGSLVSPLKRTPRTPTVPDYHQDQYFSEGGSGTKLGRNTDQAAYGLLQKYLAREPGYTPDEQKAMYDQPAGDEKLQEQGALRQLSQGAAGAGTFGSGGTQAGRGAIIGGGIRTRANLKQNIMVQAAQAAMEDRVRQIQAASDYANSHLAATSGNTSGWNAYNLGQSQIQTQQWQTNLNQYNRNRDMVHQLASKIVGSIGGGGG